MSPVLLDGPRGVELDRASAARNIKRRERQQKRFTRRHGAGSRAFFINRSLPEPERKTGGAGNGGSIATVGADVPYIPPSRHMELLSDRQVDRYIRGVLRRRAEMRSAAKALGRHRMLVPRMAGGAATAGAQSQQGIMSNPATATTPAALPFDQASKRGIEPGPSWTVQPGAGTINLGVAPLPAQGYLRAVELSVQTTNVGTPGSAAGKEEYPWNIIETARMQDTNGNQLDDVPGYILFLDNVFGGYAGAPDPRVDPDYEATATTGKQSFQTMLVRELAPNGFGAIANLSASQAYKLTLKIAPLSQIYTVNPTAAPTLLVTVWMHFWQLPEPTSLDGRPQTQSPPFHGTTQYRWWAPANSVTQNVNLKIEQVGNEIRNIILVGKTNAGALSNAVFPEPFQLRWDTEFLLISGLRQLRKIARELTNDLGIGAATAYPAGVVVLPFNFGEGRTVGGSGVNSWLPTVTGTRLQVTGTQEASTPGEIGVYVNDVSVAETNPALRPVAHGPGGYTPQVAPRLAGAA
ncbi:MAG TPA: hypothetical protein VMP89_05970 [Solirubrobacteraceae bacterium]|nr:hypothetical protein [Solirubrobacteraceae bacterium]